MAFWGIEVKPGKPIVHSCEKSRGRLRISQATLGIGDANKKSIVQCNVGNRSPVLLCVLLPNQTESCHLDLEFEEADDVTFSVIGPRSVYLTGYYVCQRKQSSPHSDSESYGVDIENTHSEGSSYCSDNDKYEDSFIDDDEMQVSPPSPVSSNKDIDETTPEKDKVKNRKGRLKKKFQVVESDDEASSCESEDDDGCLLSIFNSKSIFKNKRAAKTTPTDAGGGDKIVHEAEVKDKSKNDSVPHGNPKERVGPVDIKDKPERERNLPLNGKMTEMKDEFPKEVDTLHEINVNKEAAITNDEIHGGKVEAEINNQNLEEPKRKGKRKASSEEDKTHDTEIDKEQSFHREDKEHEGEASRNTMENGGNCKKSKKRRKEIQLEGESKEGIDKLEQDSLHADSVVKDLAANGDQEHQTEGKVSRKSELLADAGQPDKKVKKKKKKKDQCDGDSNIALGNMTDNQEKTYMKLGNWTAKAESTQTRTLSNGMVIEDLANGPTDGKVAAPGKKETGHIFDSNVGKTACRFRLGDGGVIDGWNIGIDGMHVGDKRRLIIPPSMGAGKNGARENVPPDSWLVYEVELASVR